MKRLIILIVIGATVAAVVAFQDAAREWQYRALIGQGDAALRDDQTFGAIEAYSGAAAVRPDAMLARLRRGETYVRRGELEAAVKDFRAAATLDPTAVRPLEELGDAFTGLQRFVPAADAYERAFRVDDRAGRLAYKWALASYRGGEVDRAITAVTHATRLADATPEAYHLLGLCLRDKGRPGPAEQALRKAAALAPTSTAPREDLAELLTARDRPDEALAELRQLAGIDSGRVQRRIDVALAQARAGRTEDAVLTLGRALKGTADDAAVYTALARIWLDVADAGQDPLALKKALEALNRVPVDSAASSSTLLALHGRALLRDDQLERAEELLTAAVNTYPIDPAAYLDLAAIAERRNRPEAAATALATFNALTP